MLFPRCGEVQDEVRDVRLQRQSEPRRRQHVAERLRDEGVDCRRGGKDRRAREESRKLRTEPATRPTLSSIARLDSSTRCSNNDLSLEPQKMRRTVLVPRAPKASGDHVHGHGWLYGSGTEER